MKYTITIVLLTLIFSSQTFSQEKNKTIPSPYKNLIEKLKVIHNYQTVDQDEFNKKEFLTDDKRNNKLIKKLEDLEDEFYNKLGLNDNNSRTTTTETLLADGFLQVESISQNWDGTNWVNSSRSTNVYDVRNNRIQRTYQNWNVSAWENDSRYLYTYDANDNQTEYIYQTWSGGVWVNYSRSTITYDSNNNATEYLYQSWSGSAWTNDSRYLYTYDSNNNNTQYIYQTWSGTAWTDNSRNTYTYDSNNNRIGSLYETFNGMVWVNVNQSFSTYDANNNLIQRTDQSWDGTNWVNDSRSTHTYDANDNQIIYLSEIWDAINNVWKNNSQYLVTYDANENPIEYLFQSWDTTNNVWKNDYKYTYIYDANNNMIEGVYQSWDISVWKNEQKSIVTYNANNDPTEYLYQIWDVTVWKNDGKYALSYDSNNNNTEQTYQTWDGTSWVNQYKYLYTWAAETSIILTSPNGGENWPVGASRNITWTSSNIANIKLQYSTNNGTNWINITNVSAGAGSYSWTVPNTISSNCKVMISDVSNASLFDESDSVFSIGPTPSITVNSPNGGETWDVGSSHSITWTSISIDNVMIEYSTNNGTNWITIIASTTASAGSYNWTIPNTASTDCKVQVSDVSNAAINDQSNSVFAISVPVTPTINITSPNGGESWDVGSTYPVTWTSNNVSDVKIEYSTNNGTNWITIIASTPSDGSYNWIIPNAPSTNCRIMISDVTNSTYTDQSDNVFTINVPITPGITITSPNGGEKWSAGSAHNITWISSNVTNVRIDYTTTGTDLLNIITSTSASAGSYSWTIPDTAASTNCRVIISDVSDPTTTFDMSDNVFTIFTYPSAMNLSTTYSFGDPTQTSSYQMIGLPGANNLPLANIMTGSPGVNGDWRASWDPGAGAFTEYNGSATFNFTPGKAFWVVSKNQINVNIQNVNAVTLAADNIYSIPLHNEWNLISNPFNNTITWSSVQNANTGVSQPIHFYQGGSYSNPANFDQYKGYYFFNSGNLTSLKIPYSGSNPLPKQNLVNSTEMEISLKSNHTQAGLIGIGVSEDAKQGVDMLDIFSPPSQFCEISMSLFNNEMETSYKYLQKDYRPEIGEGQEFSFNVKNLSNQTLSMSASGIDNFMDFEIYLVDKSLSRLYDLKKTNSFEVKANTTEKQYSLLIGNEEFILQKKLDLMPTEFALFQNYPNPFNPSTRIMFSLPQQSSVSLKIYNILGELAAELINNQSYEAGYHEVNFNGSQLASGIYLYTLQTSSSGRQPFVEIKKMLLIK